MHGNKTGNQHNTAAQIARFSHKNRVFGFGLNTNQALVLLFPDSLYVRFLGSCSYCVGVFDAVSGFTPISTVHNREKYDGGTIGRRSHVNVLATAAAATSLIGVRHYSWTELEITGQ